MGNLNIYKTSIYQIQMFLCVAETESLTEASKVLHLSIPTLSKNIVKMEEDLNLILFRREKNRLILSPAGKVLRSELGSLTDTLEQAILKAKKCQAAESLPLQIGFAISIDPGKVLKPCLLDYCAKDPDFNYHIEYYGFRDLIDQLRKRNCSVIFTALFEEPSVKALGLKYETILECPLAVFVTTNNPLAVKDSVDLDDLASQHQIMPYPEKETNYHENILKQFPYYKTAAAAADYYSSVPNAVSANLRRPDEFFIGDQNLKTDSMFDLVRIPIRNSKSGIILAWDPEKDPLADKFAQNTIQFWKTEHTL